MLNVALMKFPVGNLICKMLYEKAKTLGRNIDVGEASNALVSAVLGQGELPCTIFPVPAFYPIHWRKRGSFLIQMKPHIVRLSEVIVLCTLVEHSIPIYWVVEGSSPAKRIFPTQTVKTVFRNLELKAWPIETLKNGINNFRNLGVG